MASKARCAIPVHSHPGGKRTIKIMAYNNQTHFYECQGADKVLEMKEFIKKRVGVPIERQMLIFGNGELDDQTRIREIGADIFQPHGKPVYLVLRENSEVKRILSTKILDPQFDHDFRKTNDSGRQFYRGGKKYERPCGWQRLALRVRGKYGKTDAWLGATNGPGEWPAAFHGTDYCGMHGIAYNGFQLGFVKRSLYGKGHYTTPAVKIAEDYTTLVGYNGRLVRFMLQCRVDPNKMKTVEIPGYGQYWLLPEDRDLRPYGICYKFEDDRLGSDNQLTFDPSGNERIQIAQSIFSFLLNCQVVFNDSYATSSRAENSDCALIFNEIYSRIAATTAYSVEHSLIADAERETPASPDFIPREQSHEIPKISPIAETTEPIRARRRERRDKQRELVYEDDQPEFQFA